MFGIIHYFHFIKSASIQKEGNSTMKNEVKKCDHCRAKEGHKRPIGNYVVELHALNVMDEHLQLCITCYKHYNRKVALNEMEADTAKVGFYSNLIRLYKNTFNLAQKQEV